MKSNSTESSRFSQLNNQIISTDPSNDACKELLFIHLWDQSIAGTHRSHWLTKLKVTQICERSLQSCSCRPSLHCQLHGEEADAPWTRQWKRSLSPLPGISYLRPYPSYSISQTAPFQLQKLLQEMPT